MVITDETKQLGVDEQNIEMDEWNADAIDDSNPLDENIVVYSRDWTVETIFSQIESGHIDLTPEFQRRNAWTDKKRSMLIESLIMGIPVPEIILAEDSKKKKSFIVIDGKQRLLTIAGFMNNEKYKYWNNNKLTGLRLKEDLNRSTYEDISKNLKYTNDKTALLNADIRCTIISNYKKDDILYNIFYRLNTTSVPLSSQELRQVLNRGDFAKYLFNITNKPQAIHKIMGLEEGSDSRFRDIEILLRFLLINIFGKNYVGNMKKYLDDNMKEVTEKWSDYKNQIEKLYIEFSDAIEKLKLIFEEHNIGRKYTKGKYSNILNKWLLETQICCFKDISKDSIATTSVQNFRTAFEKLCDEDMEFRSSLEYSQKDLAQYKIRFSKFGKIVTDKFNITNIKYPISMD